MSRKNNRSKKKKVSIVFNIFFRFIFRLHSIWKLSALEEELLFQLIALWKEDNYLVGTSSTGTDHEALRLKRKRNLIRRNANVPTTSTKIAKKTRTTRTTTMWKFHRSSEKNKKTERRKQERRRRTKMTFREHSCISWRVPILALQSTVFYIGKGWRRPETRLWRSLTTTIERKRSWVRNKLP